MLSNHLNNIQTSIELKISKMMEYLNKDAVKLAFRICRMDLLIRSFPSIYNIVANFYPYFKYSLATSSRSFVFLDCCLFHASWCMLSNPLSVHLKKFGGYFIYLFIECSLKKRNILLLQVLPNGRLVVVGFKLKSPFLVLAVTLTKSYEIMFFQFLTFCFPTPFLTDKSTHF